ncbi:MAG TPA: MFS transporter, partial [Phycisphaerae bacterium]|nr:MFS transporter [Phycisphaerae bacterium]
SMDLAGKSGKGRRLGQVQAASFAAAIIGSTVVYLTLSHLAGKTDIRLGNYSPVFFIGGIAAIIGSVAFFCMKLPGAHIRRPKLVWRKKYWLFYVLAFLFGARKQFFMTFGPWVLIRIFNEPASTIAKLWIAGSMLQVFFQPYLGRLIDRWGERTVLLCDSAILMLICAGYGLSHFIGNPRTGLWLLYVCYVGDMMMFGVNMARSTYVAKIAPQPEDVSPTLSMGITINHAVSMSLPWLGGWIWDRFGHSMVFAGAAGIAVLMAIFSAMIPRKSILNEMEKFHAPKTA